jgi:hypothetical protein
MLAICNLQDFKFADCNMKLLFLLNFCYGIKVVIPKAEDFMTGFISFTIICSITFLHIWSFWKVYKSPFGEQPVFSALGRGFVAGAVTNYLVSWLYSYLYGGYSGALIIYGLPFSIPIGIFLTMILWWIVDKLEMSFWIRVLFGVLVSSFIGIAIGLYFDSRNNYENNSSKIGYLIYWCVMGLASGIMAGERKLNDYRET